MPKYILGIDIGGTKTVCGLVDVTSGKVIKKIKIDTDKKASSGIRNLLFIVQKIKAKKTYPLGIACAGQIDTGLGKIIYSPNLPRWRSVPLLRILKDKLGEEQKIKIENDANCFTYAEWRFGAGKGFKNVIGLTYGTGLGSGAVLDGKFFHGKMNAPEIGHTTLDVRERKCSCGKPGHLEAYASGRAMENQYFKMTKKRLSAIEIEKRVYFGEWSAKMVYDEAKKYLALSLANIMVSFDPDLIILGGSIGLRSKLIYRGLKKLVLKSLFFKDKKIMIKKARLGEDAGLIGAAMLAVDKF